MNSNGSMLKEHPPQQQQEEQQAMSEDQPVCHNSDNGMGQLPDQLLWDENA
jgi:hypothetical protein